jgi:hypothetical protein
VIPAPLDDRRRCSRKRSSINLLRMESCSRADDSSFLLQPEDIVSGTPEDSRKGQCKRQARHIAISLDRVDALTRNACGFCQIFLCPTETQPQFLDAIYNPRLHVKPAFQTKIVLNVFARQVHFPFITNGFRLMLRWVANCQRCSGASNPARI